MILERKENREKEELNAKMLNLAPDQVNLLSPKSKRQYETKMMLSEILSSNNEKRRTTSPWAAIDKFSKVRDFVKVGSK